MTLAGYELSADIVNNILVLAMSVNSVLNPWFYTIKNKNFRESVVALFRVGELFPYC